MNWRHVYGIVLRNFYLWFREVDRVFDAFWWAFFDLVIWGFMGEYFTRGTASGHAVEQILVGIIFWSILARSQWEISASMLTEAWDRNLINVFTSPLTIAEFLTATLLLGIGKLVIVFLFTAGVALVFYHFNIFIMNWWILPLLASLFLTGVWLAFFLNAVILRFGKNVMSFAWTLALIINPVSGVMYPISALPPALQVVAKIIPSSYVFEGMRSILTTGTMNPNLLFVSFFLNGIYLFIAILFYLYTLDKAREHGWLIKLA